MTLLFCFYLNNSNKLGYNKRSQSLSQNTHSSFIIYYDCNVTTDTSLSIPQLAPSADTSFYCTSVFGRPQLWPPAKPTDVPPSPSKHFIALDV